MSPTRCGSAGIPRLFMGTAGPMQESGGKGKQKCTSHASALLIRVDALLSHRTSLVKRKLSGKIIKNFRMVTAEQ